jgi:RNA polymerase sigma-70 factor (ECF subfamily)
MEDSVSRTRLLVERAQRGDQKASEELFAKSYANILQAVRFRLGPALRARLDTGDIAQSAYLEAYRDLAAFRHRGVGSFRRWLLGIVENKIRRRLEFFKARRRDLRREVELDSRAEIPAPALTPSRKLMEGEERERLERAMDQLSDDYRGVLISRYYLDLGWPEVGKQMGRSAAAARALGKRALVHLKRLYRQGL